MTGDMFVLAMAQEISVLPWILVTGFLCETSASDKRVNHVSNFYLVT